MGAVKTLTAPSWEDLADRQQQLIARRQNEPFVRAVLEGAFATARAEDNPIRGNLVATAMRELVTHLLHSMAPDERVEACPWYVATPGLNGPTRAQRASYITQGGLSDAFVADALGIEPKEASKPLTDAMAQLNKLTHVRPNTVLHAEEEIKNLLASLMGEIDALLDAADECRRQVEIKIREHVDQAVIDLLMAEAIDDLDILSSHTRIEEQESESIEVVDLDENIVTLSVEGRVYVELQYGSDGDVDRREGAVMSDSFPYRATLQSSVNSPFQFSEDSIDLEVDTSEFYE